MKMPFPDRAPTARRESSSSRSSIRVAAMATRRPCTMRLPGCTLCSVPCVHGTDWREHIAHTEAQKPHLESLCRRVRLQCSDGESTAPCGLLRKYGSTRCGSPLAPYVFASSPARSSSDVRVSRSKGPIKYMGRGVPFSTPRFAVPPDPERVRHGQMCLPKLTRGNLLS